MAFTTVTVTGKYLTPAGVAETGTVSFTLSAPMMDATGKVVRSTAAVTVTLDVAGAFSVALPANDDTGTVPTGTTYEVLERLSQGIRAYAIVVPHTAAAGTIDITAIAPVANGAITYGVTSVDSKTGAVSLAATYKPLITAPTVAMTGDSITSFGNVAASGVTVQQWNSRSILMQTVLQSQGKLRFGGAVGVSGYTSAQVLATNVPQILALSPRPTYCIVLCGTNDGIPSTLTNGTPNATQSNLNAIYDALQAGGIVPVACTLTPRNDFVGTSTGAVYIQQLNTWIARNAYKRGIPLMDLYGAGADPTGGGGWATNYNADNVHPSDTGCAALGKYIAAQLTAGLPAAPNPPELVAATNWPLATVSFNTNALFLAGTGGIPTGWTLETGGTGAVTAMNAMTSAEGLGNWFAVTPGGTVQVTYRNLNTSPAWIPGNRILLAFKVKATGFTGTGSSFSIYPTNSNGDGINAGLNSWATDIPNAATFTQEFIVPAGMSTNNNRFRVSALAAGGTVSVGQFTVIDLDAQAINT